MWAHGLQTARLLCSWGFSRQEYFSGFPCPPPGDLPDPGIEAVSPTSPALAGGFFTSSTTWEATGVCVLPVARTFLKMRPDVCYLQLKPVMAKDPAKLLIQGTMGEEIIKEGLTMTCWTCNLPVNRATWSSPWRQTSSPQQYCYRSCPRTWTAVCIHPGLGSEM